ncbi:MAG: hypothetical protein PHW46_06145, partial [Candidatus Omnitrophica bacterium]|nr:hypothetical protein [Candidatus Omnitrophota bacterium]
MMIITRKVFFISVISLAFVLLEGGKAYCEKAYKEVRAIVHVNSDITSGGYSPEELIAKAKDKRIDAVFLTEDYHPKWEYGIFPFQHIIKRTIQRPGLLQYGIGRYDKLCGRLSNKFQGIPVIMAAEVAPFYYWTGRPFREDFTLNDWDIQFIVVGMAPESYKKIPTIPNGGFNYFGPKSILLLWPILVILLGALTLKIKTSRFCFPDIVSWMIVAVGILFLVQNYPFKVAKYDQYHGDVGIGPYQKVIDYVNSKGGMIFWSNPEAHISKRIGPVIYASKNASEYMRTAKEYTGFACFYEGYRTIGKPGGIWDEVLIEYCKGKREKPVWAIGEIAFHKEESKVRKEIDEVQTVL